MSVKISATLINKNEEDFLEMTLKSIRPYVDEIVMVDTGSTDSSLDISKKYVDKLVETEWKYDFGYHRNQVMDLASNDWVLVVAGDCPWTQNREKGFHELVENAIQENSDIVVFPHLEYWYEMPVVTFAMMQKGNNGPLFNRNYYRWYGKIHEMISKDTPLFHTEYEDTRHIVVKGLDMPTEVSLGNINISLDFSKHHFRYFKKDESFALRNIDYNMVYFGEPVYSMIDEYIHSIKNVYRNNQSVEEDYLDLPLYDESVLEECLNTKCSIGPFIYTGKIPEGIHDIDWIVWNDQYKR